MDLDLQVFWCMCTSGAILSCRFARRARCPVILVCILSQPLTVTATEYATDASISYIINDKSEIGKYFRSRVHALEVFTRDELGVSSIHLNDFVKLLHL